MVELTEQQPRALDEQAPLRVVDPRTGTAYVLLRLDAYERLQALLDEDRVTATAELVDQVMAEEANDPHLAEYQRLSSPDRP